MIDTRIEQAVEFINNANGILITAGAGIGVDSGLPDFRGHEGFWKAYPHFKDKNMTFIDVASAPNFESIPEQAWGFYGHRTNLYKNTIPHHGFDLLKEIINLKNDNYFVFTSNVDGQFQKAGYDDKRIIECHGSIHHLQCTLPCMPSSWKNEHSYSVDENTGTLLSEIPDCIFCGNTARPNILMFDDNDWDNSRYHSQKSRYDKWLADNSNFVVIEIGAGNAIPTVRCESRLHKQPIIRINLRDSNLVKAEGVSLGMTALEAVKEIHTKLFCS